MNQEYIVAMKARDERTVSVVRLLKTAIKNQEIEFGRALSEEEIIIVVRRLIKQTNDALLDFERGGRADLADAARAEIAQFTTYVPAGLSEDEIAKLIDGCIAETGAQGAEDIGKVMGTVMKKIAGRADGATVRAFLAKRLSS